jgi:exosome complex component RRP42
VSDDPSDFENLPIKEIPICLTFAKIGDNFVVDPTVEEELVMSTKLTIAINKNSEICSIQKGGSKSGLDPSELRKMIQV